MPGVYVGDAVGGDDGAVVGYAEGYGVGTPVL